MSAYLIFISVISIVLGYMLGSILPAYIIGRLKGIDIRTVGSKNAGTSNVYHVLGVKYAVITGFYDFFKGLLAIWFSFQFQPNFLIAQLAGYAAIIGHVFPFYINFRGGQGLATSMAILIYYMINYILEDTIILVFLLYILLILILYKLTFKITNLLAIIMYPLIAYAVWVYYPYNRFNIFTGIILLYIVIMAFYNIVKFKLIKFEEELKHYWWKLALNPVLMIIVILYAYSPIFIPLILTGTLAIIISLIDFISFSNKSRNGTFFSRIISFFKETEEKILSISIILTSMFLTMLTFSFINMDLVIATLTYSLFGITFSGFFEKAFGKRKFLHRTLEGFIGFLISVLIFAFVLYANLELTPITLLIGGLSAALLHSLPLKINNNLVFPLLSCLIMTIIVLLGL